LDQQQTFTSWSYQPKLITLLFVTRWLVKHPITSLDKLFSCTKNHFKLDFPEWEGFK